MPTYDYQCINGHTFELFQRISDKPKGKCLECGAKATRVISGGAGLIFKGSGFYITDYGKDGKGPRKETSDGGDSAAPAKADKADKADKGADTPAKAETAPKPAGEKKAAKAKPKASE